MLCPSDRTEMHRVKIAGHYGEPIVIDQCKKCGGIWFDESELFRAKQGEAERTEALDSAMLQTASKIENPQLICPKDEAAMQLFTDKHFPPDIVLVRCPSCHGIWLNRGTFTKYQQFRQQLIHAKKSPQDEEVKERIAQLVASYQAGCSDETLKRLGEFLSTPVDSGHTPDFGDTSDARSIAGLALTTLLTILRLIFRF
jgi:Zn-finger nucleic acid-binding protein